MSDFIFVDGQMVEYSSAAISPGDAGFLHGAGLFETMRANRGKVFRARQHVERLGRSAEILAISLALSESQLNEMAAELLEANDLMDGEARLRLTISRGDTHAVTEENPTPPITLVLSASKLTPYPESMYAAGMTVINSRYKQNVESPICGHKCTSYFERLAALREAHAARAGEALWYTAHTNYLAEGCISNVFIVDKDGHLATPPLVMPEEPGKRLCLPGVMRQVVMEVATGIGILPHERMLTIHDVLGAREVFVTNVIMGVMPVVKVEGHEVGKVGSMTRQLGDGVRSMIYGGEGV